MSNINETDILERLIDNDSLFSNIHVIHQKFDIIPDDKEHFGASIEYQDITELRDDFLNELYDTIVDWIYSSKKYEQLQSSIKALAAKNGLSPIEWEGPAWIDVAKKRSNK